MKIVNLKCLVFLVGAPILIFSNAAEASINMIKAYKEAFPDAHPKCINCHVDEKPKKEDGQHENNEYGKAVKVAIEADAASAKVAKQAKILPDDLKLITDKFLKLGSFDDFKKNVGK